MKKFESEDIFMIGCLASSTLIAIFFCWFVYKIASGAYHLIDKAL